jgi:signal transduction histidine kinase
MTKIAMAMVVLMAFLPAVAPAQENESEVVVELVNKAVNIFKEKGKDYAIKVLNASAGPLRKGSLYAFAVDYKGQMLSHPTQEDLRGKDTWELQDAKGKFIIQEFIKIAKEQSQGWSEYWWLRVNESAPTLKRTYVKKVPSEDVLIGAGYYIK